nr:retrovirus-related Pol polyprotein from transposon TNT 1-94 [Tanacetum cinerariifolium]
MISGRPYRERAKMWSSLQGESQDVVVPTRREPSYGLPYREKAKFWSSLRGGESQDVVVPTGREPRCGRPYEERAKLWSSLQGESQVLVVPTGREPSFLSRASKEIDGDLLVISLDSRSISKDGKPLIKVLDGKLINWMYLEYSRKRVFNQNKNMLHSSFNMKDMGEADVILEGFCDVNWISNHNEGKSISGYVFPLEGADVSWKSSKQIMNTISTMEAEVVALDKAVKEAERHRSFLEGFPLEILRNIHDTYTRLMCGHIFGNQMAMFSKILMNTNMFTTEMNTMPDYVIQAHMYLPIVFLIYVIDKGSFRNPSATKPLLNPNSPSQISNHHLLSYGHEEAEKDIAQNHGTKEGEGTPNIQANQIWWWQAEKCQLF